LGTLHFSSPLYVEQETHISGNKWALENGMSLASMPAKEKGIRDLLFQQKFSHFSSFFISRKPLLEFRICQLPQVPSLEQHCVVRI
jgi:hypothetical protein